MNTTFQKTKRHSSALVTIQLLDNTKEPERGDNGYILYPPHNIPSSNYLYELLFCLTSLRTSHS